MRSKLHCQKVLNGLFSKRDRPASGWTCLRLSLPPLLLRHQSEMMSAACFRILIRAFSRDITWIAESSADVNLSAMNKLTKSVFLLFVPLIGHFGDESRNSGPICQKSTTCR